MAARGNATMEEAIRLVLETQGREGVDALREALSRVGDVSVETQAETSGLIDNLVELNETAAKVARYGELTKELERSQTALDQASQSAYQLTLELGNAEKPSRELVRAQKAAREEVQRLEGAVTKQWQALERADTELGSLGLNTADFSQAQADLRNNLGRTTAAVADQVKVVEKQAAAQRQLRERMEEGDDKFRKFARSGTAAAESLDAYRDRAAAARDETARVAKEADGASGVFGKLRGVVAGVFGFFSARSLIGGLKSIVTEGSNAEQELAQINAALASTGRESEFAAGELRQVADALAAASNFDAGDITNAQTRLLSYTNILRTEFPDAMQIVIDQSARLGISLEQSAEIIGRSLQEPAKAMQALGRQGFVLEESQKQLLAQLEATGQTAEAQRIIMDLLVESYGGAAAAQKVGTIAGLWKSVGENFRDFQQDIADRGVMDYFKTQLADLLNVTARLQRDGTLGRWAQQIADGIVRMAIAAKSTALQLAPLVKLVGDAAAVFARNVEQVVLLVKAYAGLKLVQLATQYASLTTAKLANLAATRALTGATVAQGAATLTLGDRLRSLPTQIRIGLAVLGLDWAVQQVVQLKETIDDIQDADKQVEEYERAQRQLKAEQLRLGRQLQALYKENADVAIKSAEELSAITREQAGEYAYALAEGEKYFKGMILEARAAGDAQREAAAHERWTALRVAIGEVETKLRNNGITTGARAIATELEGIDKAAKTARDKLGQLFDNLDFNDAQALRDVAVAISDIGGRSEAAARNVTEGLEASLAKLSGEELLKLQTNAQVAFAAFEEAPRGAAVVLETVLLSAMRRLGVASSEWGQGITTAGRDAIASFTTVATAANATAAQIEAAFNAALSLASTEAEAKELGEVMKAAAEQGKVGFEGTDRALSALRARIGEIQGALDPLNASFRRLGITSKAELDRARDAAKDAFHQIRQAAGRGEAAIEDVRAAAQRYGEAMRAAAANSDASMRQRVESEIRVMEQIFRVNDGLDKMGAAGVRAGDAVAAGADRASSSLGGTSNAAAEASRNLDQLGDSGHAAGAGNRDIADGAQRASVALGGMTRAASEALQANNRYIASPRIWINSMNRTLGQISAQNRAVEAQTRSIQAQMDAMDPLMQKHRELSAAYQFADEAAVSRLAQMSSALEQQKQQAREAAREAKNAQREQARAAIESGQGSASASQGAQALRSFGRLEIVMPDGANRQLTTDQEGADMVADMLDQLARSRNVSQLRRRS